MLQEYPAKVRKWGVFEVSLEGPSEGNPFTEQRISGIFTGKNESVVCDGFYDGEGIYRIRFMPSYEGKYTFVIRPSWTQETYAGRFYAEAAEENVHGPVRVCDTHHFAYEDGTPYISIGTTAYVWHLQTDALAEQTLKSLQEAGFNKLRFCIFPKHYAYNLHEPCCYPYEGKPMDNTKLNDDNFMAYSTMFNEPDPGNSFDHTRFNPAYFRRIEHYIEELGKIGVEADLIVMHPYDRWGFACMKPEEDDLYWNYVIARFSAFRNVWWSLANEYDLMMHKTYRDWERYASILVKKDPYRHLRSIHNCRTMYDHSRPWITHCSVQRVDLYKGAELTGELALRYEKPVVMDEIAYEGNIEHGWGNITPEEMVRRFWETAVRGGYPGHGETYLSDDGILWWSHGGTLKGESWKRFAFLADILKEVPGTGLMDASLEWDSVSGVPECEWPLPVNSMYLFYYSFMRPSFRRFHIDDTTDFVAEVIDTWNMTIEKAGIFKGSFTVPLPGRQYMAIRLRRAEESDYEELKKEETPAEEEEYRFLEELPEEPAAEEKAEEAPAEETPAEVTEEIEEEPEEEEEPVLFTEEELKAPVLSEDTSEIFSEEEVLGDDVFEITAPEDDGDGPQLIEEPLFEEPVPEQRRPVPFAAETLFEETGPVEKPEKKTEELQVIGTLYDDTAEEEELPEIVTSKIPFVDPYTGKPMQEEAAEEPVNSTLEVPAMRFRRN